MAGVSLPSAGSLRESITFQSSSTPSAPNAIGGRSNADGPWTTKLANVRARITPMLKGGETIIAQGLQGIATYVIWVRCNSDTDTITASDRIVNDRDPTKVYDIRLIQQPDEHHRWFYILAETGVA